ncbi:GSCFA domain-containing protein [Dokdonia sp. Hel_I_53]|uniref:GSCFA domain-containing protein n=1 Tax=Dokdonia sp. Hel_I_53 TaxID=1566287 RepID=UPI001199CE04|nr:GSCFA domain-containing protein [Dokdonia sp. Hel_I_53]TVZ52205.1 GSCFA family protein [Dokdonia sp. Hel_I_53]
MKLQTEIPIKQAAKLFGYENKLLLLGSCFAENIGKKLDYFKFQSVTNPFGIIFNPIALETVINAAVVNKTFTEVDVFEHNGIWKSFAAHSDLNASSRLEAVIHLQEAQQVLREQLTEASHIVITLGTSWVYKHIARQQVVANCHKVPQKEFTKELLDSQKISESLSRILKDVQQLNPSASITFTVSPIRHSKDGFVENTLSKSHLIAAVHHVVDNENVHYFPAYEIMMDELRDYRFYNADMIHPSPVAIDYIWEKFMENYAFAKAQQTAKEVAVIQQGLAHKPFQPESQAHQKFLAKLYAKIESMQKMYPFMEFLPHA